jgi:two-component system phosphate regulon response regulator PhoB
VVARTVFVIDDDPWIHEVLTMVLEDEGYVVVNARDGQEALEQLREHRPALIVLDWMMPRMNALAFTQELRRRGLQPYIPILLLTADGNATAKAAQIGADAYLTKPFDLPVLLDRVARTIHP